MRLPLLHVISPQGLADDTRFAKAAASMQRVCGPELAIHIRDPGASAGLLYDLAASLASGANASGGWCVVNERTDVALAAGAQAAQLGYRALPLEAALRVARGSLALGVSTHSVPEVLAAAAGGANYVVLGTIFSSRSHPAVPPLGVAALSGSRGGVPVVAIGGIDEGCVEAVLEAGASGVAVLSAVWGAPDPVEAAAGLVRRLLAARRDLDPENG